MTPFATLSLSKRLLASNLLISLVILPLLGVTLFRAFQAQAELAIEQELKAYSYSLLASADINASQLQVNSELADPNFTLPDSGLYAVIRQGKQIIWHSDSFIGEFNHIAWQPSEIGQAQFSRLQINQINHFNWQLKVAFEQGKQHYPFSFHIIKDDSDYQFRMNEFFTVLWHWLLTIGLIFSILQVIWFIWLNKPLKRIRQELSKIENGLSEKIEGIYPSEINQLSQSINQLIKTEQQQRQRYRNTLADLAHSLKTPLAVINSQPNLANEIHVQLTKMNNIINHQLKRAQSGGESSWHLGCEIQPIANEIILSLKKIYQNKSIQFTTHIAPKARFNGDSADLYELLGNLLDNACKACQQQVHLNINQTPQLCIEIKDDGVGLKEQQCEEILLRGNRVDTYQEGHGIGLAIVKDLANTYQAKLTIQAKSDLGGARFQLTFKS